MPTSYKKSNFLLASCAALAGIVAYTTLIPSNEEQEHVVSYAPPDQSAETTRSNLIGEERDLEKIVLYQQQNTPKASAPEQTDTERTHTIDPNIGDVFDTTTEDMPVTEPGPNDSRQKFNLASEPPVSRQNFETEERDVYWADNAEHYYLALFSETEHLAGYVLSEAECKSSSCKLSFLVSDAQQTDEITNTLIEKLLDENAELSVALAERSRDGKAVIYLGNSNAQ